MAVFELKLICLINFITTLLLVGLIDSQYYDHILSSSEFNRDTLTANFVEVHFGTTQTQCTDIIGI